jgi:hypothetical protein
VHLFEVASQVSALCEGNLAIAAGEGPDFGVFAEVVSKVTALFEHFITAFKSAREIELLPIIVLSGNFDCLIPRSWNAFKRLW